MMHNAITFGHQISMTSSVVTESADARQPADAEQPRNAKHPANAKHSKTEERVTPEMQAQEQAWALAAQQGDSSAFMHIVDAYQRPVYNLCYRMLGDVTEAEDAAQETFLRAYSKLDTYRPNRKFSSWLLSIASHYCIDRLRRQRYQLVSWDDLPPWRWLPDTGPQPEEVALAHESDDSLYALLDTLPSDYRAATILRYWYEMSYDEIAETLHTSVSAIKSRLFRARQMLARAAQHSEASALAIP